MQSATVFNIQKFSLDDGPGIRTVVFLKGCPLRCAWCSNPESQQRMPQLEWKESACVGCGACLTAAPHAKEVERANKRHVDVRSLLGNPTEVEAAVTACPTHALSSVGETKTTNDVLRVCLQDQPFYEDSGGGVTLSGGEALMWPDFCEGLLLRLHEEGIDTCIETEAHVPAKTFQRIAPLLDHMLIDLKHVDAAKIRAHTAGQADLMLNNLRWAIALITRTCSLARRSSPDSTTAWRMPAPWPVGSASPAPHACSCSPFTTLARASTNFSTYPTRFAGQRACVPRT